MKLKIGNYYLLALWRIVLVIILYISCGLVFIWLNGLGGTSGMSSTSGVNSMSGSAFLLTECLIPVALKSAIAALIVNFIFLLVAFLPVPVVKQRTFQVILRCFYICVNFIVISLFISDTALYNVNGAHLFSAPLFGADSCATYCTILSGLSSNWYLYIFAGAVLVILIFLSGTLKRSVRPLYSPNISNTMKYYNQQDYGTQFYVTQSIALAISVAAFVFAILAVIEKTVTFFC